MQGITSLGATQQSFQGLPPEEINALDNGFSGLDPQELSMLRELQDNLSELSPDKLQVLEQILKFLKDNQDNYDDAVRMLVGSGIVEAGDLPPDYIPAFFEILEQMVQQAMSGEGYARGGIAALRKKAQAVRRAGTGGDKVLAHINPREAAMLQATRGGGTNPDTGLPEYGFFDDIGNFLKKAAPIVLPVALGFMGVPPIYAGAVGSGIGAMINGASPGQALQSALLGGVTGAAFSGIQGMMGGEGFMEGVAGGFKPANQGIFSNAFGGYQTSVAPTTTYSGPKGIPSTGLNAAAQDAYQAAAASQPGIMDKVSGFVKKYPMTSLGIAGLGGAALASAMQPEETQAPSLPEGPTAEQVQANRFAPDTFSTRVAPQFNFVPTIYTAAYGGELDARAGGHLSGPGTGTSDSIPARLSDGEFVMTAKAVRGAGNGSRKAGARKMYDLMHQFEKRA